jgi:rhodanese-related sulfurtransferase
MARAGSLSLFVVALVVMQACGGSPSNSPDNKAVGGANPLGGNGATNSAGSAGLGGGGFTAAGGLGSGGMMPSAGGATTSNTSSSAGQAAGGQTASGSAGTSAGGSSGCNGTPTLGTVSPADLYAELQSPRTFLLINVHVFPAGSIVNVPGTDADIVYTDVPAIEAFIGADKSKPVVIYCMTDHMALIAGPTLVADGYCQVRYLVGGLSAWETAGYPVVPA